METQDSSQSVNPGMLPRLSAEQLAIFGGAPATQTQNPGMLPRLNNVDEIFGPQAPLADGVVTGVRQPSTIKMLPRLKYDSRGGVVDENNKLPSIQDQEAVMGAPRDVGILDRVKDYIREAASPVIGQTEAQAARAAYALAQKLPENRGGATDKQVNDLTYDANGNVKADRLKASAPAALGRGIDQLQDTGYGLAQWAATMAGVQTPKLDELAQANRKQIADNPPIIGGVTQVHGLNDAVTYAIEKIFENLPTSAPSMGAGFVTGLAAKQGVKSMALGMADGDLFKPLAQDYVKGIVASGQAKGAIAGSIAQELGSIYSDAVQSGDRNRISALISAAHAIPAGLVESIGEKMALGRLTGVSAHGEIGPITKFFGSPKASAFIRNGVTKLGDSGFEQFMTEAPTELIQSVMEQSSKAASSLVGQDNFWSKYFDQMKSPEAMRDYLESFTAGGISGVGMGGVTGLPGFAKSTLNGVRQQNQIGEAIKAMASTPPIESLLPSGSPQVQSVTPARFVQTGLQAALASSGPQTSMGLTDSGVTTRSDSPVQFNNARPEVQIVDRLPVVMLNRQPVAVNPIISASGPGPNARPTGAPTTSQNGFFSSPSLQPQTAADLMLNMLDTPTARAQARFEAEQVVLANSPNQVSTIDQNTAPISTSANQTVAAEIKPKIDAIADVAKAASTAPQVQPVPVQTKPATPAAPEAIAKEETKTAVSQAAAPAQVSKPIETISIVPVPQRPNAPASKYPAPVLFELNADPNEIANIKRSEKRAVDASDSGAVSNAEKSFLGSVIGDDKHKVNAFNAFRSELESIITSSSNSEHEASIALRMTLEKFYKYAQKISSVPFSGKGDETSVNTGPAGFKRSSAVRESIVDAKRKISQLAQDSVHAVDESGTKDLTDPNDVQRPDKSGVSNDLVSSGIDSGEHQGDWLGVRNRLLDAFTKKDPKTAVAVVAAGVDALIQDTMFAAIDRNGNRVSGGVNMAKMIGPVKAWIDANKESFKGVFREVIENIADELPENEYGDTARSEIARSVKNNWMTGTGSGVSEITARQSIIEMLGSVPDNVVFVNDPNMINEHGQPVRAAYVSDGKSSKIILNLANISGSFGVKIALLHEGLHQAWDHPSVQRLAGKLMESELGSLEGYSPSQIREELAVRAATDSWASDQSRSLFQKLIDALWSGVKHLFGIELTSTEMRRSMVRTALGLLSQNQDSPRGGVMYDAGPENQVFRSKEQRDAALNNQHADAVAKGNIETVANATATLLEGKGVDWNDWTNIKVNRNDPAGVRERDRAKRRAGEMLSPLTKVAQMLTTPTDVVGLPITIKDIAAYAVLETSSWIRNLQQTFNRRLVEASRELNEEKAKATHINALTIAADAARAMTVALTDAYQEQVDARIKLGKNLNQQEQLALERAKKSLGVVMVIGPSQIDPAILQVAQNRPMGVDPLAWLRHEAAAGWPSFGGAMKMTEAAFDFLAGPVNPALDGEMAAIDRITKVALNKLDAQRVVDNVSALFKSLGSAVQNIVTPRQFAAAYNEWHLKNRALIDQVADYNAGLRRRLDSFNALTIATDQMQGVLDSPSFRDQQAQATESLDASARIIQVPVPGADNAGQFDYKAITDWTKDGHWMIRSPSTFEVVRMKMSPTESVAVADTATKAQSLIDDIDAWMLSDPNNPPLERTYAALKQQLQSVWLGSASAQMLIGQVSAVPFTREWFNRLPHAAVTSPFWVTGIAAKKIASAASSIMGQVIGREMVYASLGLTAGRTLIQYMGRANMQYDAIRAAEDNSRHGADAIKKAMYKQAKAHGLADGLNIGQAIALYEFDVTNFIFANSQDPGTRMAKPGDRTLRGVIISKEDIDVALRQYEYAEAIRTGVSRGKGGVATFSPTRVMDDRNFRKAKDYGLKMQRRPSIWGMNFSTRWEEALKLDAPAVGPVSYAQRVKLLDDDNDFRNAVNGMIATVNSTYKVSDSVQAQALSDRFALGPDKYLFNDTKAFLDWMSQKRSDIKNAAAGVAVTTPAEERSLALKFLISDLDKSVHLFMNSSSNGAESSSRVMGVGNPITESTSGASSFNRPRGNQIAPNPFYDYTIGQDIHRVMMNSNAMRNYQKQELDVLRTVIASMESELGLMTDKYKAHMDVSKAKSGSPIAKYFSQREFSVAAQREIMAGRQYGTIKSISQTLSQLRTTESGMQSAMAQADIENSQALRMWSKFEVAMSIGKLLSLPVQFTNFLSAGMVAPLLFEQARARGNLSIMNSLIVSGKMAASIARNVYRSAVASAIEKTSLSQALRNNPAFFLGFANHISKQIMSRQNDINLLATYGVHRPPELSERLGRWFFRNWNLASTSGTITDREGSGMEAMFSYLMAIPEFASVLGGWATSHGESLGARAQMYVVKDSLNALKVPVLSAYDIRSKAGLDMKATLAPRELGVSSITSVNFIRDLFAPAGNLEHVMKNYHDRVMDARSKGATQDDIRSIDLMLPDEFRDVMNRALSKGNLINESGKGEGFKGKGGMGIFKGTITRFMSYPQMLSAVMGQTTRTDIRDASSLKISIGQAAAATGFISVLAILALANIGGGQWLRQIQTGKVPSTPTVSALLSEGPVGLAKAFVTGGANLFMPIGGDYLSSFITGQKGRDPSDLTSMFPGAGSVAAIFNLGRGIAQSGDLRYPLLSFMKSQITGFESIYNRTEAGQQDLDNLNASRAFRSAALPGMEVRQPSGGTVKLGPTTQDSKDAMRAAAAGDQAAFNAAIMSGVGKLVKAGADPLSARTSFLRTLGTKSSEQTVFGKQLTPDELARTTARMTNDQRSAVERANLIGNRIATWTGKAPRFGAFAKRTRLIKSSYLMPKIASAKVKLPKIQKLLPKLR